MPTSDNKDFKRSVVCLLAGEGPKIQQCPANLIKDTDPGKSTTIVVWEELLATDSSGDAVNVMCSHVSGAQFDIGHVGVVCEAIDNRGIKGECQFDVTINGMSSIIFYKNVMVYFALINMILKRPLCTFNLNVHNGRSTEHDGASVKFTAYT